jgi:hypothetical protein
MTSQAVLARPEETSKIERPTHLDGMNVDADADSRQHGSHWLSCLH